MESVDPCSWEEFIVATVQGGKIFRQRVLLELKAILGVDPQTLSSRILLRKTDKDFLSVISRLGFTNTFESPSLTA